MLRRLHGAEEARARARLGVSVYREYAEQLVENEKLSIESGRCLAELQSHNHALRDEVAQLRERLGADYGAAPQPSAHDLAGLTPEARPRRRPELPRDDADADIRTPRRLSGILGAPHADGDAILRAGAEAASGADAPETAAGAGPQTKETGAAARAPAPNSMADPSTLEMPEERSRATGAEGAGALLIKPLIRRAGRGRGRGSGKRQWGDL